MEQIGFFDAGGIELAVGDKVLVETDAGPKEGRVAIAPDQVAYSGLRGPMLSVLHRIDED
jgi:cell fate regulator YaaT (PSP1 superfamily)